MKAPPHEIRGATPVDQHWIDETIEGGVTVLGWSPPAPRPAHLDAPKAKPKPKVKPAPKRRALTS